MIVHLKKTFNKKKVGLIIIILVVFALGFLFGSLTVFNKISLEDMKIVAHDSYQGNEGDSTILNLNGNRLSVYDSGRVFNINGSVGVDGTRFSHSFEIWLARWNDIQEISWASATFSLNGKYTKLTGKTSLINSFNTTDFDTTIYFYDGNILLNSYRLTDSNYEKDINIDVSGVENSKIYAEDNRDVAGGTSLALYDMFLK